MKVLSDNTADKLVRLLSDGGGLTQPRRARGAPTTPPARMWQIHVTPSGGVVTVDGGDVYADGARHTLAASSPGTASATSYVVWQGGTGGGSVSLVDALSGLSDPYRVLGRVVFDQSDSTYHVEQFVGEPIEVGEGGVSPGPDAAGEAIAKTLGGTDYNAAADTWEYGDTDATTGKPTYPVFNPTRLYWQESVHTLWMFRRTETHNSSGLLVRVSAEVRETVFTAVQEMP